MTKNVIIIVILFAIVLLPKILWELFWFFFYKARLEEFAQKPFVCPNCGERFYTKWYKLYWFRRYSLELSEKAKLKCPKCGETDMCRWMSESE